MERIRAVLSHPDFVSCMEKNEAQEIGREFCHHNLQHVKDVARILYILFLEDGRHLMSDEINKIHPQSFREVLYAAGLLHDIGKWQQYLDKNVDHAAAGALLAQRILKETGFSSEEIKLIEEMVRAHRNPEAKGLGGLLYRADKYSRECSLCTARERCNKLDEMEALKDYIY